MESDLNLQALNYMDASKTLAFYQQYIDCLNNRAIGDLGKFVNETLTYNEKPISLADYQEMLAGNFRDIPDLYFHIDIIVPGTDRIACRLNFDCTPADVFMGIPVHGKRVSFSEHVFYELRNDKIAKVWSLIDKDSISDQIAC